MAEALAARRTAAFRDLLDRMNRRFLVDVPGVREVWLIRHADAYSGLETLAAGPVDPPLSPRGRRQAELLSARMAPVPIHAVWSSDLRRARQTAETIGRAKGLAPRLDCRLREVRTHWDEGATEIATGAGDYPFPEPEEEVLGRMRRAMDDVLADLDRVGAASPRAAVVSHNAAIVVYVASLLGLSWRRLPLLPHFTSVTVIARRGEQTVVRSIADATHLTVGCG